MNIVMNIGFNRGGRGGGGFVRGGVYLFGYLRKFYEKLVYVVQQFSLSGLIGVKDFVIYFELFIGK